MTGNNGTADLSYTASIADRAGVRPATSATTAGLFHNGTKTGAAAYADFGLSYDPYNSGYQGAAGGTYTVRAGDTLQSIAAALYGDANLWYKLAAANGMSGNAALIEGQTLTLPTGVTKSGHSASTFKPYDPTDALGDLSPTAPKPPKKPKCGMFGQILVAAIAIAVTAILPGSGTVVGAMINGAIGSAVSQGVGVATGIQDKFSLKGVAVAAIGGGIGGALGDWSALGKAADGSLKGIANAAIRGAAGSALSQGIGVATGLQSKFDFAGVAAAGLGAGIGAEIGGALATAGASSLAARAGAMTASAISSAATRSALTGDGFGDSLERTLPSAIGQFIGEAFGNTIGNLVAGGFGGRSRENLNADLVSYSAAERAAMSGGVVRSVDLPPSMASGGTAGQAAAIAITGSRASVTGGVMLLDDPVLGSSGGAVTGSAAQSGVVNTSAITYGSFTMRLGGSTPLSMVIDQNFMIADFGGAFDEYVARGGDDWVVDLLSGELGRGGSREGYLGNVLTSLGSMSTSASAGGIADRLGQRLGVPTVGDVSVIFDPSFAAFAGTPAFDTSDPLAAAAMAASGHSYAPNYSGSSQSSRYIAPGWLDSVSDYSPVKFNRVYEDVANLPRDIRRNGLDWFLRDLPPTLGGGATSVTAGAAKGTSAVWNLVKPGTAAIDDLAPVVIHGNSKLSPKTAYLYELYMKDGTFLKYGISQNPATRYSKAFMENKEIYRIASGSRTEMLALEREMVIKNPGPLNLEPWAVKARGGQ